MSSDITHILQDWPYEPGKVNVRIIKGEDGEPRLQLRLDLGLLQMCTHGRPDGARPHGFESLLEYHTHRLENAALDDEPDAVDARGDRGEIGGIGPRDRRDRELEGEEHAAARTLGPEACRELREEAAQYYHRYVALFVLDDYDGVVRDTSRNLRVLELCEQHAEREEDRRALLPVRPYITMMRSRALAGRQLAAGEPKAAVLCIDDGIESLREHFERHGEPERFETCEEVGLLRSMRDQLVPKLPVSQKSELRARLRDALAAENYELAAILRDELRQLSD